ncbi:MAG: hypothetical protein M3Z29_13150 [Pseudomonadota bacterium]|nr:hypothetical protein [Pseudomonadota bacterium]
MTPSVVAAFTDRAAAKSALERLRTSSLPTRDTRLHQPTSDVGNVASLEVDEVVSGGFFGNAARLLDGLFDTPPDKKNAADYAEMVRREATLLSVEVDTDDTAREVSELLTAAGAQRVWTLPQPGLES